MKRMNGQLLSAVPDAADGFPSGLGGEVGDACDRFFERRGVQKKSYREMIGSTFRSLSRPARKTTTPEQPTQTTTMSEPTQTTDFHCAECGRDFGSAQAFGVHRARAHGYRRAAKPEGTTRRKRSASAAAFVPLAQLVPSAPKRRPRSEANFSVDQALQNYRAAKAALEAAKAALLEVL